MKIGAKNEKSKQTQTEKQKAGAGKHGGYLKEGIRVRSDI